MRSGGLAPTVLNAANEIAVQAFLDRRIGFLDIPRVVGDDAGRAMPAMAQRRWLAIWTRCWAPTRGRGCWRKKSVNGWGCKRSIMLDALHSLVAWTPLGLPAFLFVITLVVFFHELGHFLVARACGVKVDVFSVGFGREIVGWTDKRGTRWKVSWLPSAAM